MRRGFCAHPGNSVWIKKKDNSRSNARRPEIFSKSKARGFFRTLTSSKAEKPLKSMYVNGGAMSRSWFERLWQPESGGYSCTRASEVDITIGTPCTLPGLSVYACGSFPRWSSQTRTESEFTNYPSQEHSRAERFLRLGHLEMHFLQSIWRVWSMTEWDWDRRVFDFNRC